MSRRATPFSLWLLITVTLAAGTCQQALATACPAGHTSERVHVRYVLDGDTLTLTDGRRVRFIGINTPETGHHGKPRQALAEAARTNLIHLLETSNHTLLLQHGEQPRDHYGRLLAHAFLENGVNVAAQLLRQGLATTLVIPPNTWGQPCYRALENSARAAGLGLWALQDYQPHDATSLPPDTRGFRIIHGRITEIRRSRRALWLEFAGHLTVRLAVKDLSNFDTYDIDSLVDKTVEVRGWVRPDRNQPGLQVQHPAAVVIIAPGQHP